MCRDWGSLMDLPARVRRENRVAGIMMGSVVDGSQMGRWMEMWIDDCNKIISIKNIQVGPRLASQLCETVSAISWWFPFHATIHAETAWVIFYDDASASFFSCS